MAESSSGGTTPQPTPLPGEAPASSTLADIPVFVVQPSWNDFKDFRSFITKLEHSVTGRTAIVKVKPPPEWRASASGYSELDLFWSLSSVSKQTITGLRGTYQIHRTPSENVKLTQYQHLADRKKPKSSAVQPTSDNEELFWHDPTKARATCVEGIPCSLVDESQTVWNPSTLDNILSMKHEYGEMLQSKYTPQSKPLPNVQISKVNFNMWGACQAWQTCPLDLYGLNFLHFGDPVTWYVVPREYSAKLEQIAAGFYPAAFKHCPAFLRHRNILISPDTLRQLNIPIQKVTQCAGEFIITFPSGYFCTYNHGYNCMETVHFATPSWVSYAMAAKQCTCPQSTLSPQLDLDLFVRQYKPEMYTRWKFQNTEGPDYPFPTLVVRYAPSGIHPQKIESPPGPTAPLAYNYGEHYTKVYTLPTTMQNAGSVATAISPDNNNENSSIPKEILEHPYITEKHTTELTQSGHEKKYKCRVCGKGFSQAQNVGIHMRQHTGDKPYACEICGEKFTVLCNMKRHRAKNHAWISDSPLPAPDLSASNLLLTAVSSSLEGQVGTEPLHKCYMCTDAFKDATSLAEHTRSVHKSLDVIFTSTPSQQVNNVSKDIDPSLTLSPNSGMLIPDSNGQILPLTSTPISQSPIPPSPNLISLPKVGETPKYPCDLCGKSFTMKSNFQYHMRECHPDDCQMTNDKLAAIEKKQMELVEYEKWRIEDEKKRLEAEQERLDLAEKQSKGAILNPGIEQAAPTFPVIQNFMSMNEELTYSCPVCFKLCKGGTMFLQHIQTHDNLSKQAPSKQPTLIETIPTMDVQKMVHQESIAGAVPETVPKPEDTNVGQGYKCDQCTMVFSNRFSLRTHKRTHPITQDSTSTTYPCTACKRTFATSFHLKAHLKTHMVDRPYVCPQCNKGLKDAHGLMAHIKVHGITITKQDAELMKRTPLAQKMVYHCQSCDEEFEKAEELVLHVKGHGLDITVLHAEGMKRISIKKETFAAAAQLMDIKQEVVEPLATHSALTNLLQKPDSAADSNLEQPSDMTQATLQAMPTTQLISNSETHKVNSATPTTLDATAVPFYQLTTGTSLTYSQPPPGMVYVQTSTTEPPPVYAAAVAAKKYMLANDIGGGLVGNASETLQPSVATIPYENNIESQSANIPMDYSTSGVVHADGTISVPPNSVLPQQVVPQTSVSSTPTSIQTTAQKVFPCSTCKKTFSQRSYVRRHMKVHGPTPFICQICPTDTMKFGTETELKEHIKIHMTEVEYNSLMNLHFPVQYVTPEIPKPDSAKIDTPTHMPVPIPTAGPIHSKTAPPLSNEKREKHFTSEGVREMAALQAQILEAFCEGQAPPMTSVSEMPVDPLIDFEKRRRVNSMRSDSELLPPPSMFVNDPAKTIKTLLTSNMTPQQYAASAKSASPPPPPPPSAQIVQQPDGTLQYVPVTYSGSSTNSGVLSSMTTTPQGQQMLVQYVTTKAPTTTTPTNALDLGPDVELADGEPSAVQYIAVTTTTTQPTQTTLPSYGIAMGTYLEGDTTKQIIPRNISHMLNAGATSEWSQFEAAQSLIGLHGNTTVSEALGTQTTLTLPTSLVSPSVYQSQVSGQTVDIDQHALDVQQSPVAGVIDSAKQSPIAVPLMMVQGAEGTLEYVPQTASLTVEPDDQDGVEKTLNQVVRTVDMADSNFTGPKSARPFFCSICERKFSQKTNISRHMMLHTGIRPYRCSTCQRGFIQSQSLRQHRLRHHPDEPVGSISPISQRNTSAKKNLGHQLMNELPSSGADIPGDMELQIELPQPGSNAVSDSGVDEVKVVTNADASASNMDQSKVVETRPESPNSENVKTTKVFSCPVCGRTFTRKLNMHAHLLKHTDSKPYKCNICSASFSQTIALKNHMMKIHQAIVNYRQITEQMLVTNEAAIAAGIAPTDNESVTVVSVSEDGMQVIENEEVQPAGTVPLYAQEMEQVQVQHTIESATFTDADTGQPMSVELFKCALCESLFTRQSDLEDHVHNHVMTAYACETCNKGFPSSEELEAHRKEHMWDDLMEGGSNSSSQPPVAPPTDTEPEMPRHTVAEMHRLQAKFSEAINSSDPLIADDDITSNAPEPIEVSPEKPSAAGETELEALKRGGKRRIYQCHRCMRKFACQHNLDIHFRIHTGQKPYQCGVCGKRFTQSGTLNTHKRTHTGERPFKCQKCLRSFSQSQSLKVHRCGHPGKRTAQPLVEKHMIITKPGSSAKDPKIAADHAAAECLIQLGGGSVKNDRSNKVSAQDSVLSDLTKTVRHTVEYVDGKRMHRCGVCLKLFRRAPYLKIHMRSHTGERPYKCPQCTKSFAQPGTLRTHLRTHTDDRPFQCNYCSSSFRHSQNLRLHEKSTHYFNGELNPHSITKRQEKTMTDPITKEIQEICKMQGIARPNSDGETTREQVLNGEHYRQNLTSSVAEEQYIDNIVMEHADGNVEELAHSQMVDGLIYEEGIQSNRVQHGEVEYESLMQEEMAEEGQVAAEEIVTDDMHVVAPSGLPPGSMYKDSFGQSTFPGVIKAEAQEMIHETVEEDGEHDDMVYEESPVDYENQQMIHPKLEHMREEENMEVEEAVELERPQEESVAADVINEDGVEFDQVVVKREAVTEYAGEEVASAESAEASGNIMCEICDQVFSSSEVWIEHLKLVHAVEPASFECSTCQKVFLLKNDLALHEQTHVKAFHCTQCGTGFSKKISYVEHMATLHSEHPANNVSNESDSEDGPLQGTERMPESEMGETLETHPNANSSLDSIVIKNVVSCKLSEMNTDSAETESPEVSHPDDQTSTIVKNAVETDTVVKVSKNVETEAGENVEIEAPENVEVETSENMKVKASENVEIDASDNVAAGVSEKVKFGANKKDEIESGEQVDSEANENAKVEVSENVDVNSTEIPIGDESNLKTAENLHTSTAAAAVPEESVDDEMPEQTELTEERSQGVDEDLLKVEPNLNYSGPLQSNAVHSNPDTASAKTPIQDVDDIKAPPNNSAEAEPHLPQTEQNISESNTTNGQPCEDIMPAAAEETPEELHDEPSEVEPPVPGTIPPESGCDSTEAEVIHNTSESELDLQLEPDEQTESLKATHDVVPSATELKENEIDDLTMHEPVESEPSKAMDTSEAPDTLVSTDSIDDSVAKTPSEDNLTVVPQEGKESSVAQTNEHGPEES